MRIRSGIYKITNLVNGKMYIGSSINLKARKWDHFKVLKSNRHYNSYLQRSYNKYGKENFKWEVVEYVDRISDVKKFKEVLLRQEQYWIDSLNTCNRGIGYNLCKTAGSPLGVIRSEETREKLRIASTGKKHSKEQIRKMSYYQKNRPKDVQERMTKGHEKAIINLTTGEVFNSIKEASESNDPHIRHISCVCKGKRDVAGGYQWAYMGDYSSETFKRTEVVEKRKRVINLTTGEVFISITAASQKYKVGGSNISLVCQGKRNSAGGYKWVYYNGKDELC